MHFAEPFASLAVGIDAISSWTTYCSRAIFATTLCLHLEPPCPVLTPSRVSSFAMALNDVPDR